MIRCWYLIALGLFVLIVGQQPTSCPEAHAAAAQPPATEAQAAPASQTPDTSALSNRVSHVEGRLEGMEDAAAHVATVAEQAASASAEAARASAEASRSAGQVMAAIDTGTKVVGVAVTLLGVLLGALGYKGWRDVREAAKEADDAAKAAATCAASAKDSLARIQTEEERATKSVAEIMQNADESKRLLEQQRAEAELGQSTEEPATERTDRMERARRTADTLELMARARWVISEPDINLLNRLSGLLDQLGRYEDAARYAAVAIAEFPDDVGARFNKAVIEIHRGGSAGDVNGRRSHWREALRSFDETRRLHAAGTRLDDVNYGKMWLFAGETAQYIGQLGLEHLSDWRQKAAASYNDGYKWLIEARGRATKLTLPAIDFWAGNGKERFIKLTQLDKEAAAKGPERQDIARLDNTNRFWRDEDEIEYRKLVGLTDESDEGEEKPAQ